MSTTPSPTSAADASKQTLAMVFGIITILISAYGIFNMIKSNFEYFSELGVPPIQFLANTLIWFALEILFLVGGVMILQGKPLGWAIGTARAAIGVIGFLFSNIMILTIDVSYLFSGWQSIVSYLILAANMAYLIYVFIPATPGIQGFRKDHRDIAVGLALLVEVGMRVLFYFTQAFFGYGAIDFQF